MKILGVQGRRHNHFYGPLYLLMASNGLGVSARPSFVVAEEAFTIAEFWRE